MPATPPAPIRPAPPLPGTIAVIGGGNMARALVGGWIAQGVPAASIRIAEPQAALRDALHADFAVDVVADAGAAIQGAATWLLAVKPQAMRAVCEGLAVAARAQHPLVVSIAAGVTCTQLARWFGAGDGSGGNDGQTAAIVRCMPNTPALLGAGITGLFAGPAVDAAQRARAEALLASAGQTLWVDDEALMDAVTGVSGSGPAYVFLLAQAMEAAALGQGLDAATARALVQQTILGAARMLVDAGEPPGQLRERVTSAGGTTQAAIDVLQAGGFTALVSDAVHAATIRSAQLSSSND